MPMKHDKPCKHPGCPLLTSDTYCEYHIRVHKDDRPNAYDRGYNNRWRKASMLFLKANPLCKHCEKDGKLIKAEVVDHITPHRGDQTTFWDESNWQPLCTKCHNRKTRTEDQHPEYKY